MCTDKLFCHSVLILQLTPNNSNFFQFPLKVPVIGSQVYMYISSAVLSIIYRYILHLFFVAIIYNISLPKWSPLPLSIVSFSVVNTNTNYWGTSQYSLRKQPTFCDTTFVFPFEMTSEEWVQKFHTNDMSLPSAITKCGLFSQASQ